MIDLNIVVDNKSRKFGSATSYIVGYVRDHEGNVLGALFTDKEIKNALERAGKNPEDVPAYEEGTGDPVPGVVDVPDEPVEIPGFFGRLFRWFGL